MKSQLKNLAMATAIMFVPLKSTNTVRTVKPVAREFQGFEQLIEKNKQDTKKLQEVIYAPFLKLQKLEAEKNSTTFVCRNRQEVLMSVKPNLSVILSF